MTCIGKTIQGIVCRNTPSKGSNYCWRHADPRRGTRSRSDHWDQGITCQKCQGINKDGTRCKRNMFGVDFCFQHKKNDQKDKNEKKDIAEEKKAKKEIKETIVLSDSSDSDSEACHDYHEEDFEREIMDSDCDVTIHPKGLFICGSTTSTTNKPCMRPSSTKLGWCTTHQANPRLHPDYQKMTLKICEGHTSQNKPCRRIANHIYLTQGDAEKRVARFCMDHRPLPTNKKFVAIAI